ncbi:hypothetical protein DES35_10257 [Schleiferia thermophila]|jgi:hypothetical protein|uniref:Uncharacterized protein n=1 Tax=Schleiferia thermophila TaxID=884107 RepID=A0A369A5C6_9FLAO|nr:hypothetical protein DES35_10257 [Schleiferia thermophila]
MKRLKIKLLKFNFYWKMIDRMFQITISRDLTYIFYKCSIEEQSKMYLDV